MPTLTPSKPNTVSALADVITATVAGTVPDRAARLRDWAIALPRIRLADRLRPPGRFTIDAAEPDWLVLAVVLEGAGVVACAEGTRQVATGEAVLIPPGQAVALRSPRWIRFLVVGGLAAAMPAVPTELRVIRNAGDKLEQLARLGRNTQAIAAILDRSAGSAFDAAVDESVFALLGEIVRRAATATGPARD